MNFLTEYILDSHHVKFDSTRSLLNRNRAILREKLRGTILDLQESFTKTSVAWCEITDPNIKATELQKYLYETKGIYFLPGTYFYWHNPETGERYIRIALARDTENFVEGMTLLKQGLETWKLDQSVAATDTLLATSKV